MTRISMKEAVNQLERLIQLANEGEVIILTESDQPKAQIVPLTHHRSNNETNRVAGSGRGVFHIMPDFDEPLDEMKEYSK